MDYPPEKFAGNTVRNSLAEPRLVVLEGSVDKERFDEVSEDGQPEDEAEAFLTGLMMEEFLTSDRSGPASKQ